MISSSYKHNLKIIQIPVNSSIYAKTLIYVIKSHTTSVLIRSFQSNKCLSVRSSGMLRKLLETLPNGQMGYELAC